MMKKQIIALLLSLVFVISLSACKKEEPAAADSSQMEGYIEEATTMNTYVIRTKEGEVYSFSKTDDTIVEAADGIIMGNPVTLTYSGSLNGTDTSGTTLLKIVDTVSPNKEAASLEGTVEAVGMSTITIKPDEGESVSFLKEDTAVLLKENLVEGIRVNIIYTEENGEKYAGVIEAAAGESLS